MQLSFSFIIPVFNRPDEIKELLESFSEMENVVPFEIVIVEDGSSVESDKVVERFKPELDIKYFFKSNTGPGDSRNFGMQKASGNYFIILDSDCILPKNYLKEVNQSLHEEFVHCFGGPDAAHDSFSKLQKAINFSMTSFLSTGGIRGSKKSVDRFQPRSFNMGLSREAYEATGGFGKIHPGEDPDLTIRLWDMGYDTKLIPKAKVFHKRRISWSKFYKQVYKFGMVRPILNHWHPQTSKMTYWFPTVFSLGLLLAIVSSIFGVKWLLFLYLLYIALYFFSAMFSTKSIVIALQSLLALCIQMFGYGWGFLKSTIFIKFLNRNPESSFPELFFK